MMISFGCSWFSKILGFIKRLLSEAGGYCKYRCNTPEGILWDNYRIPFRERRFFMNLNMRSAIPSGEQTVIFANPGKLDCAFLG
jgi:hypothetical protein